MKPYDYIKQLLEMNVYEEVRVFQHLEYVIITDIDWEILRHPFWHWRQKNDINSWDITSITPIPRVPKLLPVGTKVRVFEEYDDTFVFGSDVVFVIDIVDKTEYVLESKEWLARVPHRAVYPIWEREE